MDHVATIRAKLQEKRAALSKLDRQRETLLVEVRTIEEILGMVSEEVEVEVVPNNRGYHWLPSIRTAGGGLSPDSQFTANPVRKSKGLSHHWKAILGYMASAYPKSFTYDELVQIASLEDVEMTKNAARTKMMGYANDGFVERISDGVFRMTERGAAAVGVGLGTLQPPAVALPVKPSFFAGGGADLRKSEAGVLGDHASLFEPAQRASKSPSDDDSDDVEII